ncbi:MAG: hypothetical protein GF400_05705 [Candidatus Eisenbacteria bacterium]|nr:hypothetical protein [Candidatus Eisenbacteria bacterium]
MKRALIALMVLALAAPAFAGVNPDVRAFVTMDPAGYVHTAMPASGDIVNTYLCFDCLGDYGEGGGLTGVSLVLDFVCGGFTAGSADVTIFHPSAQTVVGGPDDLNNGWVIAAPECVVPDASGIICVAMIPWYYTGPAGDILILPSPADGKATVDCNNDLDFFCVLSHGALGQDVVTPGDADCLCEPPNPVEDSTWGAIKGLYR